MTYDEEVEDSAANNGKGGAAMILTPLAWRPRMMASPFQTSTIG
jgi:hypothetical protein